MVGERQISVALLSLYRSLKTYKWDSIKSKTHTHTHTHTHTNKKTKNKKKTRKIKTIPRQEKINTKKIYIIFKIFIFRYKVEGVAKLLRTVPLSVEFFAF